MNRALEFIDGLERTESAPALLTLLHGTLASFGLEYFAFQDLPDPRRAEWDFVLLRNVCEEWRNLYLERQYHRIDPSYRHCRKTTQPFVWANAPYDAVDEPEVAEFVGLVSEFGLARGLMIPVPRLRGRPGVVWFGGTDPEFNPHTIATLQLVALYAHHRLREMSFRASGDAPVLTSREREVLAWIAVGKTAWEIGEILGIAKRTVDSHAKAAIAKLDAANRAHAVALALRQGLLDL